MLRLQPLVFQLLGFTRLHLLGSFSRGLERLHLHLLLRIGRSLGLQIDNLLGQCGCFFNVAFVLGHAEFLVQFGYLIFDRLGQSLDGFAGFFQRGVCLLVLGRNRQDFLWAGVLHLCL